MRELVSSFDTSVIPTTISKQHFFLRQNNIKLLASFVKRIRHYDCVMLEFPYLLGPLLIAKIVRTKVIVDEHNVEYLFNKDAYETRNRMMRWIILLLTSIAEWISLHSADGIICCSSHDKHELARRYNIDTNTISVFPNAVSVKNLEQSKPNNSTKKKESITLLFVGSQDHYPNKVAIEYIAESILPQLDTLLVQTKTKTTVEMRFVGKNAPASLRKLSFEKIRVTVKENVADIGPELWEADIGLAPLFHGSGTRIKILEYLATDTVVIATQKATEGLELTKGVDYICEDDVKNYAERILDVIVHSKRYHAMKQVGKKTITKKYAWERHAKRLKKYIKDICS